MGIPLLPRGEGLTKYCSWGAWYTDGRVQVPHVRKIATNGRRFAKEAKFKCGDTDELVRQFLEEYQVKLGHTYLLDTALGAYEAWGSNNNGDAFREQDLMVDSDDHGYRSFKKHAHVFRHHQNQDPSKAVGKVVLAAYNRDMKRVEVIEELNDQLAGDLLQKWANEGSLPTSMGCKIAYDVCAICNNRAPSARVYCEHAKYAMNRVWEDGRKVCVWNPNPKFFDQSHVLIPAEKIAGTMMKVASANHVDVDSVETPECVPSAIAGELRNIIEISDEPAVKVASEIVEDPDIAELRRFAEADETLPLEVLDELRMFPLHKVASTLTFLGIVPKPEEWQYLVLCEKGHDKLARAYHEQGICFDPNVEVPELTPDSEDFIRPQFASVHVAKKLAGWVEKRSIMPQFLGPRIDAFQKTAAEAVAPEKIRKGEPSLVGTMAALGVSYGLVRAIQGSNRDALLGLQKSLGSEPIVSALLIAAGVAAALRMGSSFFDGKKPEEKGKIKVSSLIGHDFDDLPATTQWGGKHAAAKGLGSWIADTPEAVKGIVLPFGLGYMSSAYYRAKQMQGQPTTSMQNLVADHPLASGVTGVGAAAAVRRALRR